MLIANRPLFAEFKHYASRSMISMLGVSCYILADTFFIARGMGTDGIAALNLVLPVYSLISGCGLMLGMGGATRYAILRGQGKKEAANGTFTQVVALALLIGLLLLSVGAPLAVRICQLLRADAATLPLASVYLRTVFVFGPAFLLNNLFQAFVRNDGAPGLAMRAMLTGSVSNTILDYIFIFPLDMGMFGAAFATGLAPVFSLLVMSSHYRKKQNHFHFARPRGLKLHRAVNLGLPSLVTELSSGLVMLLFNLVILRLAGNIGLAAYGVIANLALIVVAVFTGLGQGVQPLLSRYDGAGEREKSAQILRYALASAGILGLVFYAVGLLFPAGIVAIFNSENSAELAAIAIPGIRIYFTAFLLMGFNIITAAYFAAVGRAGQSFAISLSRGCVFLVPLVLVLPLVWGLTGVWCSVPLAELGSLLVAAAFLARYIQREKRAGIQEKAYSV